MPRVVCLREERYMRKQFALVHDSNALARMRGLQKEIGLRLTKLNANSSSEVFDQW